MTDRKIADISTTIVGVSDRSNWIFVEVILDDGTVGTGEATLHGYEPLVEAWFDLHGPRLLGMTPGDMAASLPVGRRTRAGLAAHAAISALEQARTDFEASAEGRPISAHMGGDGSVTVPLYANINRGLTDRHPDSFAAAAARAVGAGFDKIKIAPFDGVRPTDPDSGENERLIQAGLDRIAAIRDLIGPDVAIYVDCHWRFGFKRARRLVGDLAEFDVTWLECPVPEIAAHFDDIARLRGAANDAGMVLAGAELEIGLAGFRPFLDLYDVVMPDMKYCGGPAELRKIADAAADAGCRIAPHNPSGPIAHAHTVHAAAHPAIFLLEHQFGESPLFDQIVTGSGFDIRNGMARTADTPGLGARLDHARCAALPRRRLVSFD